jgi:hypothetical protein
VLRGDGEPAAVRAASSLACKEAAPERQTLELAARSAGRDPAVIKGRQGRAGRRLSGINDDP